MDTSIVRGKNLVRTALVIPIAGLAADAALASPQAAAPEPRTLTVSGEGHIKAVPDEARLSAGVVTQAQTAQAALDANRRAMNAVFAELKRQGIPDKSMQTSGFSVSPQYDSRDNTAPKLVGYQVTNTVSVTVDDLSKLGAAIDALVGSGANSMGGIDLTVRDPKPLLRQAREAAIKDAIDRAQTDARAAGVTLGRVMTIGDGGMSSPRPMNRVMALEATAAPTPIAAGEETVSAGVSMTFEIR
jgi:uncharacterized protein YggE